MRILIVDDNKETIYLLETLLKNSGYQTGSAGNGAKALEQLRAHDYGLIISDILMPGMDGFEFCRQVKRDPMLKKIPFVFYTATYTDTKDEELAHKIGACRFIRKPADPEAFLGTIKTVVREAENGEFGNVDPRLVNEYQSFKLYNERLVAKLEKKMLELEAARVQQEQARQELQLFRTLVDHSNDAVFVIEPPTGRLLDVNQRACESLGYTREELMGLRVIDIEKALPDAPSWETHVRELETQGSVLMEGGHRAKDGTVIPVEINVRHVIHEERPYVVAVARDITNRKRLEFQLVQAQKMEAVGRFAGGIAHDFNNVLTAIIGHAELLLLDRCPDHQDCESIRTIREAAERAALLSRQLLAFTRRQALQPVVLNLNEVIRGMTKILSRLVGEDMQHYLNLDPDVAAVKADPGQLEQLVLNLVSNAREAMPHGGKLTIRTENKVLDSAYARFQPNLIPGPYVLLSVSDTGVGMSEDVRKHLFEPFFTTKTEGTGLGLSTVYGIVQQMGGHVHVYSEEGRGSTFKIYLPACQKALAVDKDALRRTEILPTGNETLLVVEDQPTILSVLVRVLGDLGYTVLTASNAEAALALFQKTSEKVDLLLTDVILPGKNGPKLALEIRALKPDVRVLFMSGYAADRITELGFQDLSSIFLQKPFTPSVLAQKVRQVLDSND